MNVSEFNELRPLLFSIAYRMLSSVADAEDVVQDAFLRYQGARARSVEIDSVRAYLSATVTRLSIDRLRSAKQWRETYSGNWLPEPLMTDVDEPAHATEMAETISTAFLLVLERLNPIERAVFLLHDVFAYDYAEIATIVERSPTNCRQLAVRARRHVERAKPRFEAVKSTRDELATRFFAAVRGGDVDGLVKVLAHDVVVYGDGGGKAPQWSRPIEGVDRASRLLAGLSRQIAAADATIEQREINGQPGALIRDPQGRVISVFMLDVVDGAVQTIRSVINPDKLRHLGPVADVWELLRQVRDA